MDKRLQKMIDNGRISSAQGRSIEAFVIGTFLSFVIGFLDLVETRANGGEFTYKLFLGTFATATMTSIFAGIRKYLRDKKKKLTQ